MKKLLMLLPLLFAPNLRAAPVTRTINDLVSLAMEKGEESKVGARTTKNFGLKLGTPTRAVWIDQGVPADGYEHNFEVLLEQGKPSKLLWNSSIKTQKEDGEYYDGYELQLSLNGTFQKGFEFRGYKGKLIDTPLKGKKAKDLHKRELLFWTVESISLPWGK